MNFPDSDTLPQRLSEKHNCFADLTNSARPLKLNLANAKDYEFWQI
jgi:hypothetical protein